MNEEVERNLENKFSLLLEIAPDVNKYVQEKKSDIITKQESIDYCRESMDVQGIHSQLELVSQFEAIISIAEALKELGY